MLDKHRVACWTGDRFVCVSYNRNQPVIVMPEKTGSGDGPSVEKREGVFAEATTR